MSKYSTLLNILDKIRNEAPPSLTFYKPEQTDNERINQARARAYIHLFLKANIGLLNFDERESYITDGPHDGGVDGFFINFSTKTILFIQSKFGATENNFKNKAISVKDLLKMDIDRITKGEIKHENGVPYNAKILAMQQKMVELPDISRYTYEVIILANLSHLSTDKIQLLTGLPTQIYDFKKTFSDLVFPIIAGTFYNYSDLNINVNLSNKSSGAHINYSVETALGMCDITVLFVPLNEIGKLMYEYKNSILKYNPRSYLTLKEGSINDEIKQTILTRDTNEFALFNNGITILSDDTDFNYKIGQKDKGRLSLKNPQIINGGQTAFTLSLIYEESLKKNVSLKAKLENKEVLVKIITFSLENTIPIDKKLELIESISDATNKQNQVNSADRSSNNPLLIASQKSLFTDFGFLLERKRGEFYDGLRYGYIDKSQIIDRGIFMRIAYSCLGYPVPPKKEKQLFTEKKIDFVLNDFNNFRKYFFGCLLYSELQNTPNKSKIAQSFTSGFFSILAVGASKYFLENKSDSELKNLAITTISELIEEWSRFEDYAINRLHNSKSFAYNFNFKNKSSRLSANFSSYFSSPYLSIDLNNYFFDGTSKLIEDKGVRNKMPTLETFLSKNYLTIENINQIEPLIHPINWFDKETILNISNKLSLSERSVGSAIKIITSKEFGYYFADNKQTQPDQTETTNV